jgi:hypothetical protein
MRNRSSSQRSGSRLNNGSTLDVDLFGRQSDVSCMVDGFSEIRQASRRALIEGEGVVRVVLSFLFDMSNEQIEERRAKNLFESNRAPRLFFS